MPTSSPHTRHDSEAAQADLIAAQAALHALPDDAPATTRTALQATVSEKAWALALQWESYLAGQCRRLVVRHRSLPLDADDLTQEALVWAHRTAMRWDATRGSWPGFLRLCLTRRLRDHLATIRARHGRVVDITVDVTNTSPDATTAPQVHPVDPRPSAEQILLDHGLHLHLRSPGEALRRLLLHPDLTLPERGACIQHCGLRPAFRRLLSVVPLPDDPATVLALRLGVYGGEPASVGDVAARLRLTRARVKLLQRAALTRLQEALRRCPTLSEVAPSWPVLQEPLLKPRTAPDGHTAPPRSTTPAATPAAVVPEPVGAQLCLMGWLMSREVAAA